MGPPVFATNVEKKMSINCGAWQERLFSTRWLCACIALPGLLGGFSWFCCCFGGIFLIGMIFSHAVEGRACSHA